MLLLGELLKVNANAHVGDDGWVGLGVIARDSGGSVFWSTTRRCHALWLPEVAEVKASLFAARLA